MGEEIARPAWKPSGEGDRRDPSTGLDLERAARTTRRRYDRISGLYDALEGVMEALAYGRWRRIVWNHVERGRDRSRLHFSQMDAQRLAFPDGTFGTVVSTFVFCSVPDPEVGLREIRRVLRPEGRLVLLEHVLSGIPGLRRFMRLINPVVVRLSGANIDRETVETVRRSGFELEELWDCGVGDIFKIMVARRPEVAGGE